MYSEDRISYEDVQAKSGLLVGVGFLLHFLAFILSAIAFFSPFWMIEVNSGYKTGLWGRCDRKEMDCIWFHERNYAWEKHIPEWHIAAQATFAIGFFILTLGLLASVGQLIFHCCRTIYILPFYVGISVAVTMVFELISIVCFGSGAYMVYDVSINSWLGNFIWAFYVGICSLFLCTASSAFYIMGGWKMRSYMKYYGNVYK